MTDTLIARLALTTESRSCITQKWEVIVIHAASQSASLPGFSSFGIWYRRRLRKRLRWEAYFCKYCNRPQASAVASQNNPKEWSPVAKLTSLFLPATQVFSQFHFSWQKLRWVTFNEYRLEHRSLFYVVYSELTLKRRLSEYWTETCANVCQVDWAPASHQQQEENPSIEPAAEATVCPKIPTV